jgi:hypothetical protein
MGKQALPIISFACLLAFLTWGCSSKTGWSKAQIESKIKEAAKLKEVHLTETGNGTYEGTATDQNGTAYKIKATYSHSQGEGKTSDEVRWEGEDAKGNRIEVGIERRGYPLIGGGMARPDGERRGALYPGIAGFPATTPRAEGGS